MISSPVSVHQPPSSFPCYSTPFFPNNSPTSLSSSSHRFLPLNRSWNQQRSFLDNIQHRTLKCGLAKPKEPPSPSLERLVREPHKYFDEVIITVRAGDGGHGATLSMPNPKAPSKAHTKQDKEKARIRSSYKRDFDGSLILPMGGHGGDVVIYADEGKDTLLEFHKTGRYNAKRGGNVDAMGVLTSQLRNGFAAPPLRIPVPLGTVVKHKRGKFLADLARHGDEILVARGGQGGISLLEMPEHRRKKMMTLTTNVMRDENDKASFMPVLVLASRLCPEGMEATLFATLMSVSSSPLVLHQLTTSQSPCSYHYHLQNSESVEHSNHPINGENLPFKPSRREMGNFSISTLIISFVAPFSNCKYSWAETEDVLGLERYTDFNEGFTLLRPSDWVKVEKAGATVLFEDPSKGSNNLGVVVTPVRLTNLRQFGDPQFVANKLIQAENRKESTKMVELISFEERAGREVYEFEYQVDSTRGGLKKIFSAAFVASKKLYLLNIAYAEPLNNQTRTMLQQVLHSFDLV